MKSRLKGRWPLDSKIGLSNELIGHNMCDLSRICPSRGLMFTGHVGEPKGVVGAVIQPAKRLTRVVRSVKI